MALIHSEDHASGQTNPLVAEVHYRLCRDAGQKVEKAKMYGIVYHTFLVCLYSFCCTFRAVVLFPDIFLLSSAQEWERVLIRKLHDNSIHWHRDFKFETDHVPSFAYKDIPLRDRVL
jgi:hypothetical protein